MIIDCFTFYNELEMLKFRLKELNDVVDYFVIVEADHTQKADKKELFFKKNKKLYSKYLNKIIHIVVTDMPNTKNSWDNENHQRRCIDRGIKQLNLSDGDVILITDLDEIPDSDTLKKIKSNEIIVDDLYALIQDFYYYNLNTKRTVKWPLAKIINHASYVKKYNSNCQKIRMKKNKAKRIEKGGWHFSYFGSADIIKNKINSIIEGKSLWKKMHKKDSISLDVIEDKIKNKSDLYNRKKKDLNHIEIKDNNYLPNNYKMLL